MRITAALLTLLGVVTLCTILAAASGMLTVDEAKTLYLAIGTPLLVLTGFAVGFSLSQSER
jgi:hypothetical protein